MRPEHRPRRKQQRRAEEEINPRPAAAPPGDLRIAHRQRRHPWPDEHQRHAHHPCRGRSTRDGLATGDDAADQRHRRHQDHARKHEQRNLRRTHVRRNEQVRHEAKTAAVPCKGRRARELAPGHGPGLERRHALPVPGARPHLALHGIARLHRAPERKRNEQAHRSHRERTDPFRAAQVVDQRKHEAEGHRPGHQPMKGEFQPEVAAQFGVHTPLLATVRR